jgi:hypothetical protein
MPVNWLYRIVTTIVTEKFRGFFFHHLLVYFVLGIHRSILPLDRYFTCRAADSGRGKDSCNNFFAERAGHARHSIGVIDGYPVMGNIT